MKCVILQPSYIPWRGYFHQIQKADLFIFYDDVQFDRRGWRNRNQIKAQPGNIWLTIPVLTKGRYEAQINQIKISSTENWRKKHLASLRHSYSKAPFFKDYFPLVESILENQTDSLADLAIESTIKLAGLLGITQTKFEFSSNFPSTGRKGERVLEILKSAGASHYITGPKARNYLDEERFRSAGMTLEYMSYDYPEYPQLYPPFAPQVSILDLLFMTGSNAYRYIWGE